MKSKVIKAIMHSYSSLKIVLQMKRLRQPSLESFFKRNQTPQDLEE